MNLGSTSTTSHPSQTKIAALAWAKPQNDEIRLPQELDMTPSEIRNRYAALVATPLSELETQEIQSALFECAYDAHSTPEDLLVIIKQVPALEFLLKQDARIRERYTIEEHTSMVLRQIDTYLSAPKVDCILNHAELRIAALFHDIGKTLPDEKKDQHLGTLQVLSDFDQILPLSQESKLVIKSLIANDPIGKFIISTVDTFASIEERQEILELADKRSLAGQEIQTFAEKVIFAPTTEEHIGRAVEVASSIFERAKELEVSGVALINLHKLFYGADTAAYTYDAVATNGRRAYPGLDFLYALNVSFEAKPGEQLLSTCEATGLMKFGVGALAKLDLIHS